MKIHMQIANGYKEGKIKQLMLDNPTWDRTAATSRFVSDTYGNWITQNLGTDFAIIDVTEDTFRINFTYEDDADAFQRQIGGSVVEE
ncbi:hypothetical protein ACQKGL_02100 [Ensifer adhaerens]|uniref:hypothetical protein n=1 Tax=Ensifer adhaerens TaxID=106592 RepID=UPI003CFD0070